jgi:hypothetical protein
MLDLAAMHKENMVVNEIRDLSNPMDPWISYMVLHECMCVPNLISIGI